MADHTPVRNDDLAVLRKKRLAIPELFVRGCFTTSPVGAQGGFGPSATELLLWLPIAQKPEEAKEAPATSTDGAAGSSDAGHLPSLPSPSEVRALLGTNGREGNREVPSAALDVLVGPELVRETAGERSTINGIEFAKEGFGNIFWKPSWAIGTPKGVLVRLLNS